MGCPAKNNPTVTSVTAILLIKKAAMDPGRG